MRTRTVVVLLLPLVLSLPLSGQSDYARSLASASPDKIISGIQGYDPAAIREAGRRCDSIFLPYLREGLATLPPGYEDEPLRLALARCGEPRELERVVCKMRDRNPRKAYNSWGELAYVGGWLSVSRLEPLLDKVDTRDYFSEEQWKRYHKAFANDEILPLPRDFAVAVLPRIVPGSPFPPVVDLAGIDREQLAKAWKEWLVSHHDAVVRLAPTGEGADFSDSLCEEINRRILLETIKIGSPDDLIEAGMTGDPAAIPALRAELRKRRTSELVYAARMSLAMLGEVDQLQRLACEAYSRDPNVRRRAMSDLELVQGWFSFGLLQRLLTTRAREAALKTLPKLVYELDFSPPSLQGFEEDAEKVDMWKDWIAANREILTKLEPTGEGVDFSGAACRSSRRKSVTKSSPHEK